MTTATLPHDTISELRQFVVTQATEDAVLPAGERSHQLAPVTDVLGQEALKPAVLRDLVSEYRHGITEHTQIAA